MADTNTDFAGLMLCQNRLNVKNEAISWARNTMYFDLVHFQESMKSQGVRTVSRNAVDILDDDDIEFAVFGVTLKVEKTVTLLFEAPGFCIIAIEPNNFETRACRVVATDRKLVFC
jgi:hypothetical protein